MNKLRRPSLVSVALVSASIVVAASSVSVAATVITGAQIKDGTVTGVDVKNASLGKGDLTPGAVSALRNVRGWATVRADGSVVTSTTGLTVRKSSALGGTYCLRVPGVDGRLTAPVAGPDYRADSTDSPDGDQAFVEVGADDGLCKFDEVQVNTFVRSFTSAGGNLTGTSLEHQDQPFFIVVP